MSNTTLQQLIMSAPQYTQPSASGPTSEPDGTRTFPFVPISAYPAVLLQPGPPPASAPPANVPAQDPTTPSDEGSSAVNYLAPPGMRLPPIMQVEKQQVTTSATQLASASRRRNEANFACPVPGTILSLRREHTLISAFHRLWKYVYSKI